MIPGVDAYDTLSGAALAGAGRRFAGRYISGNNPLTLSEARDLTAHGIGIVSLFENNPAAALGGSLAGHIAGIEALRGAELGTKQIRMPRGSGIVFAIDFNPTQSDCAACVEYWNAAASVLRPHGFRMGGYGQQELVERSINYSIDIAMVAAGWRSGYPISPDVQLVQAVAQVTIGGAVCDQLEATTDHFGAWNLAGVWPPAPRQEGAMRIAHTSGGAAFVVDGSRKMPVDRANWSAIAAQGLPAVQMTDEELTLLAEVPWGTL